MCAAGRDTHGVVKNARLIREIKATPEPFAGPIALRRMAGGGTFHRLRQPCLELGDVYGRPQDQNLVPLLQCLVSTGVEPPLPAPMESRHLNAMILSGG